MAVKVLDRCHIAPPPVSVPTFSLPLTFFDMLTFKRPPIQRIFFYELSCSASTFLNTHLPNLKHYLSLSLQRFPPLAGGLVLGPGGAAPTICYSEGDRVAFTVAESDDDFYYLSANHPRDITRFHSLVPELFPISTAKQPVLSVQVTLFPGHGFAIGTCVNHVAADGSTSIHFMKTWASICKLKGGEEELPFYDRSVIRDPKGLELEKIFLTQLEKINEGALLKAKEDSEPKHSGAVMATFVLNHAQLDRLVRWVSTKTSTNCSTFSLTCAVVWTCLLKARSLTHNSKNTIESGDNEKIERMGFVSNCRGRFGNPPIPQAYFGNCVGICFVKEKSGDLVDDESGLCTAAMAIGNSIQKLKNGGVLREAESWFSVMSGPRLDEPLTVAGSPKLGVYDVDFGWGKPKKVEVVLIDKNRIMSLAENGDEGEGGVEVGLALPSNVMYKFASLFDSTLTKICS